MKTCIQGIRLSILMVLCAIVFACDDTGSGQDTSIATGTIVLPLLSEGESGTLYRLINADFEIYSASLGSLYDSISTDDYPDSDSIRVNVPPDEYSVMLVPGWVMEMQLPDESWVPVDAVLMSENSQWVQVYAQYSRPVVFSFSVGEEAVPLGEGQINIVVEVDDDPSPGWSASACGGEPVGIMNGEYVANFTGLIDQDGNTVNLDDFCGKYVMLIAAALWSTSSVDELIAAQSLVSQYGAAGFEIVALVGENANYEPPSQSDLQSVASSNHLDYTLVADPEWEASNLLWGSVYAPQGMIINRDGSILDTNILTSDAPSILDMALGVYY